MYQNLTMWSLAYIAATAFMAGASIIFWAGLRDFLLNRNFRKLLFGSGLLFVSFAYFIIAIINTTTLVPHIVIPMLIGYNLLFFSLARGRYTYLFLILNALPIAIAVDDRFAPVFAIGPALMAWLSYQNYCTGQCGGKDCDRKRVKNREVTLLFCLLFVSTLLGIYANGGYYSFLAVFMNYALIVVSALIAIVAYYHIFRCNHFGAKEKIFLPMITIFIFLISFMGFYSNQAIRTFNERQLVELSLREARAALYMANKIVEPKSLGEMVEARDPYLNDVTDVILLETGFRTAIFNGNERIAASVSATGGGRFIGTKMEDEVVRKKVLEEGGEASAKINKIGQNLVAGYVPIINGDRTVGMIGSGILLTDFYRDQEGLLFRLATLTVVLFVVAYGAMAYDINTKKR